MVAPRVFRTSALIGRLEVSECKPEEVNLLHEQAKTCGLELDPTETTQQWQEIVIDLPLLVLPKIFLFKW